LSEAKIFRLVHSQARNNAVEAVRAAPDGDICRVGPPTRSLPQNDLFHALLQDVAATKTHAGVRWEPEDWKRLLTAAWVRATGGHPQLVPSLEGGGFDVLYRRTSQLTKPEMTSLIEYVHCWMVESDGVVV